MDAKLWVQIKEVYNRALDLGGDEREGFLAETCGDDDYLRREVQSLLSAHEDAGTFLQSPAVKIAAREIVADEVTSPAPQLIGLQLANYLKMYILKHRLREDTCATFGPRDPRDPASCDAG